MPAGAADAGLGLEDPQLQVLNAICLKKMANVGEVADATGLSVTDVEAALGILEGHGLVAGAAARWLPTNDAVPAVEAWAAAAHGDIRGAAHVEKLHARFEEVNVAFLQAMSAWQQIPVGDRTVANDHTDAEYDAKVIAGIEGLVRRLGRIIDRLAQDVPRLTLYAARFEAALGEVGAGRIEYVARPTVQSVHNVWFEFHEDLLRILGKERRE